MNDVHSRKCLYNVHMVAKLVHRKIFLGRQIDYDHDGDDVDILASLQYQMVDASVITLQFEMHHTFILISQHRLDNKRMPSLLIKRESRVWIYGCNCIAL